MIALLFMYIYMSVFEIIKLTLRKDFHYSC